jgi:Tfp pilus assembly protein PilF
MPARDGSFVVTASPQRVAKPTIRQSLAIAGGYLQAGDSERAEQAFLQIARHDPRSGEAHFFLGVIHQQRKDVETAIRRYEEALRLAPDLAEAHNNLGVIHQTLGRFQVAEESFREALRLEPDYAEAHNNLGNALQDQGQFEQAVTAYRLALLHRPRYVEALKHLGNALRALGRLDEAIACYNEGLRLDPGHILLHTARAMVWIQMGDLVQGFAECEWRLEGPNPPIKRFTQPVWDGAPLDGRTLLICTEQGLGDTLQFIRYAAPAAARGGRVVVACPPILARILRSCPGVDEVVCVGSSLPEFDCHAPVMSLARILGTTLETIPAEVPYLASEPALVEHWRAEFEGVRELKIGVVWQGNPVHNKDRERSFRLAQIEPVARVPGVRLFSIQKNFGLDQLETLPAGISVTDLGSRLDDFVETAAVMKHLDLVISVDSSPAHLAGALAVPVWLVLPSVCDWRWITSREDTPWYPTMRLFRQRHFGDWDEVFDRVSSALSELLQSKAVTGRHL